MTWTDYADEAAFEAAHAPGLRLLTASRWPCLVIPVEQRPGWMPSPYRLALHMTGEDPLPDGRSEMDWGTRLEPVAMQMLKERHPQFEASWGYFRHASLPAIASPDMTHWNGGKDQAPHRSAEIKIVFHTDVRWRWADGPPISPRVQAQCQMACGGHDEVLIFGAVIGHKELPEPLQFVERRNPKFIAHLERAADLFMTNLEKGRLPKPDPIGSDYAAMQKRAPKQIKGKMFHLPGEEAVARYRRWRQSKLDARAGTNDEEAQKFWFAVRVPPDVETVMLDTGEEITRKMQNNKGYTVEPYTGWVWNVTPRKAKRAAQSNEDEGE